MNLKAQVYPHSNRDRERNSIRSDSTNGKFDVMR